MSDWDDHDFGRDAQEEADRQYDYEIAIAQIMSDNERNEAERAKP